MTGRIHIDIFSTLDGVGQAPGGSRRTPRAASDTAAGRAP